MRQRIVAASLLFITALAASPTAQWPRHRTTGAPRLADGRVDLAAPAPTFLDGKPDLSGVWENPGWREAAVASGAISGVGGAPASRSAGGARAPVRSIAAFFDVGTLLPDGLPYLPAARALRDKRAAENARDNPDAHCLPLGNMQLHLHPQPRKIVQSAH